MKKVFAFLSLVVGLGLSSLAMAQGPADYSGLCTWDEAGKPRKPEKFGRERIVQSLEFTGATDGQGGVIEQQVMPVAGVGSRGPVNKIYVDKTGEPAIRVSKGDAITLQPRYYELFWMHFYLYIDFNQDGVFADDELVSYTHFRQDGSDQFYDSAGNRVPKGDVHNGGKLPVFTIPQTANTGLMRARFKCDWNNKDACGADDLHQNRGTICDFPIEVLGEEDPGINTSETVRFTVNVEGGGTAKIFNVITEAEVTNLDELENNSDLLELRPVPHDGWELTGLTVDGRDAMADRNDKGYLDLMPDSDKTITVKFERKTFYSVTLTYSNEKDAKIVLVKGDGTHAESGDLLEPGTQLTVIPFATSGRRLTKLVIDGEDRTADLAAAQAGELKITVDKNYTIHLEAERIMETLIYEFNAEGGSVKASLQEDGTPVPSGSQVPQYDQVQYEVEANEGYALTFVARRDNPSVNLLARMPKIADNVYSVPVRPEDPGFIFTFTKTQGVEDIKALGYNVRGGQGMVVVEGATGQTVELYNVVGVRVAKTDVADARVSLSVAKGVYVVKIGKATAKVVVD